MTKKEIELLSKIKNTNVQINSTESPLRKNDLYKYLKKLYKLLNKERKAQRVI